MKFLKSFAKKSKNILFCCFLPLNTNAQTVFYTPTENEIQTQEISQKSFLETSYGNASTINGTSLKNFNRFQQGRLNARSIIEAKDFQNQYSAKLDIQIGTDVNEDQSTMFYINQGYFELKNVNQPIKTKVRIGIQNTATSSLTVNSGTPMKNHQGINGNWYRYIQMPVINQNGGYNPTFVLNSMPLSSQGFTDATFLYSTNSGNLNFVQPSHWWSASNVGIGFLTERKNGFMLAFSYQPSQNTGNFGINANGGYDRRGIQLDSHGNAMFTTNLTSTTINYLNEFNGVAVNASLGFETAEYKTNRQIVSIDRHRLSQITAGVNVSYLGLTFGGSYSNAGQSVLLKANKNHLNSFSTRNSHLVNINSSEDLLANANFLKFQDTYNFDFGISYSIAQFQAGIAHAKSHFAGNRFSTTILSLSEDLKSTHKIKLTALYEIGFYNFLSASYFKENGGNIEVASVPKMKGFMGSVGLRISI